MTEISDKIQSENHALTYPDRPWLFQKGQSGNPLGRPRGSKNRITQLLQNISEDDQRAIADRLVKMTKDGGLNFFKICLPYIVPKAKAPITAMI